MATYSSGCNKQSKLTIRYKDACTPSVKSTNLNSVMGFESNEQTHQMNLDFASLETRSLLRYWRRFNLGTRSPNLPKDQLVTAVQQHFSSQAVDEEQTIVGFIWAAKRLKSNGANDSTFT